jgi:hypothetical protein
MVYTEDQLDKYFNHIGYPRAEHNQAKTMLQHITRLQR